MAKRNKGLHLSLPHTSIRWKILLTFLLIVGLSFGIMASMLTGLVSDYLYSRQVRQDSQTVEKLATTLAPYLQYAASATMDEELRSSAGEMGGRLLVLDTSGKVQYDSFSRLYGIRLELPEVIQILRGASNTSYGIHKLTGSDIHLSEENAVQVSYCASVIIGTYGRLGVLLYVSNVDEMVQSLTAVEKQMILLFMVVAVIAMLAAVFFSRILTKPILSLTATIQKMGRGDLSVRAPVKGSGEFRELASSYNTMAEQLESLDQSRNQFVSNASHELKTPLTTMKILLESLIYQPDMPEELRTEFLGDVDHEIDRLTSIVTDLLTLTRMDDHKLKLSPSKTDICQLTRETIRLLTPQAEKRGQTLTAQADSSIFTVADAAKISQVFYNLIENALKYTPDGGRISVTVSRRTRSIVWTVTDTGVGIPAEDQLHIFDRFYRVDKARSRETGGTGLGLSIVKQLVTMHGGEISVRSTYGEGSAFTVILPIKEEVVNE